MRLFVGLIVTYAVLGGVFIGIASQDAYAELSSLLDQTGGEIFVGGWSGIGQTGLLLLSGLAGSINPDVTDAQRVYSGIIILLTWLTTVWLLRSIMAGERPRLRDGLYNAGGPIVATAIIFIVLLIQLVPAAVGVTVFNSAVATGIFESGFLSMIVTMVVGLLVLLSAYFVVSTVIALVIVTLPGMYPWQALRAAGDMVVGRRMRILLRLAWMMLLNTSALILVLMPIVYAQRQLVAAIPAASSVPIVPVAVSLVGAVLIVWSASYVYILYRKVVQDDADPA